MASEFAIYEMPLVGGTVALSPLPGRGGDYAGDLAVILAWAPDGVISLTATDEMPDDLHGDLRAAGAIVWAAPVPDYGVPGGDVAWEVAALAVLRSGGRVLAHCKGGCGRSGMAVLRLMVASGEAPDAALARLRAVRPCAVETDAQLAWAIAAPIA